MFKLKRKYLKKLRRELKRRGVAYKDVIADISEAFDSASDLGETEEDVAARLGDAAALAARYPSKARIKIPLGLKIAALASALSAFAAGAVLLFSETGKAPGDAIGYAESTTDIHVTGGVGSSIWLIVCGVCACVALLAACAIVLSKRRKAKQCEK